MSTNFFREGIPLKYRDNEINFRGRESFEKDCIELVVFVLGKEESFSLKVLQRQINLSFPHYHQSLSLIMQDWYTILILTLPPVLYYSIIFS